MLGYDVSERTVSRYLPKRPPDEDKFRQWKTFLENHRNSIAAMDLFTIPLATFRVLYALVIIDHGRRVLLYCNIIRTVSIPRRCGSFSNCARPFPLTLHHGI